MLVKKYSGSVKDVKGLMTEPWYGPFNPQSFACFTREKSEVITMLFSCKRGMRSRFPAFGELQVGGGMRYVLKVKTPTQVGWVSLYYLWKRMIVIIIDIVNHDNYSYNSYAYMLIDSECDKMSHSNRFRNWLFYCLFFVSQGNRYFFSKSRLDFFLMFVQIAVSSFSLPVPATQKTLNRF